MRQLAPSPPPSAAPAESRKHNGAASAALVLLFASCETRSAARWTVAAADEPGVLLFRECGYAQPVAAGADRESRKFREQVAAYRGAETPPMRGLGGSAGQDLGTDARTERRVALAARRRAAYRSLLSTSLRWKQVSLPAVRTCARSRRSLLVDRRPTATDGAGRAAFCPKAQPASCATASAVDATVGARTTAAVEARPERALRDCRFVPHVAMTIFPWECPSPWYRRASGTSLKA